MPGPPQPPPSIAVPNGSGRAGEDADVLRAVNPVKLKKASSGRNNQGQGGTGAFGLDAVPFTPSQGIARTPSSSTSQFNFDPQQLWGWGYGARPPESPSMGRKGSDPNHPAAFPFPPYFMAYSMPYPEETDPAYVPPSPLMGSPVGTPTAMMFPQTPFAGAHSHPPHPFSPYPGRPGSLPFTATSPTRSPSYMDAYPPMSPSNYGCFHPMFNSFPAFPLAPLQQNNSASPRKGPAGSSLYSSNSSTQGSAAADKDSSTHSTMHDAATQQQRKPERAGDEDAGLGFDFGQNLGPGWGPWGGKFSPFSFPHAPHYYSGSSTLSHTSSGSFCMPMHLLQPLYALSSMGSIGPHWPAPPTPPHPPSPGARLGPAGTQKGAGRASSSAMSAQLLASQQQQQQQQTQGEAPHTHSSSGSGPAGGAPHGAGAQAATGNRNFPGGSGGGSASQGGGESGADSASAASSTGGGGSGQKGKPRPPPLQLNMISGMGSAAGGIAPIPPMPIPIPAPSTPGTPPAPAQQPLPSLPSMPFPFSAWEGPMPDLQPPPMAGEQPPFSPTQQQQHLPPFMPPLNPPMPSSAPSHSFAPPPFCPLPGPYSMPPHPFMPMPMPPYLLPPNMHPGAMLPFPLLPPHLAAFPGMMPSHPSNIPPHPYTHPRHSHGASPFPHPRHPRPHPMHHVQQHQVHSVHGSPPNASGAGPKPGGKQRMAQAGGQAGGNPANSAAKGDAQPRLNARQRRTLRRAKERAIRGLMEAGHLALKQQQGEGQPAQQKLPEEKEGEDLSGSDTDEAARAAAAVDNAAASSFFSAAMSVVAGSHGPEAAANASEAISKVAADLEDIDLTNLISHLSQRKETHGGQSSSGGHTGAGTTHSQAGAASHPTEEALLRDLQIIQNLIGLLKAQQGGSGEAGGGRESKEAAERGGSVSEQQRAAAKTAGVDATKGAAGGAAVGRQGVQQQTAQMAMGATAMTQQQPQSAGVPSRAHEGPGGHYDPLKLTQQMRTVC